jgi:hypothetical protein
VYDRQRKERLCSIGSNVVGTWWCDFGVRMDSDIVSLKALLQACKTGVLEVDYSKNVWDELSDPITAAQRSRLKSKLTSLSKAVGVAVAEKMGAEVEVQASQRCLQDCPFVLGIIVHLLVCKGDRQSIDRRIQVLLAAEACEKKNRKKEHNEEDEGGAENGGVEVEGGGSEEDEEEDEEVEHQLSLEELYLYMDNRRGQQLETNINAGSINDNNNNINEKDRRGR